jgi:hypothetical protein
MKTGAWLAAVRPAGWLALLELLLAGGNGS